MTTFRVVAGTKTLRQVAVELKGHVARPPAKLKPQRKKLPRTFDRRDKSWTRSIRAMPQHTPETMLELRRELSLSRADAARLLRVARNTLWGWECGDRSAPFSAFLALSLLADRHSLRDVQLLASAPLQSAAPALPEIRGGRRAQAAQLQERMLAFTSIYNAGWLVRDSWHGSPLRRQELAWRFANVLAREMRQTRDFEALLFAVADTLTCSKHGCPWEP